MLRENTYIVNQTYVDKGYGGKSDPDDQLQNWNISSENISIQNSGGIRPRSFNKKIRNKFKIPSSLYIFDVRYNHKDIDNPWINKIDLEKKTIEYCGDALFDESNPSKKIDNFKGNKIFNKIFNQDFIKIFTILLPNSLFY